MTGFEPQASGIGATAPPTEPQPLPLANKGPKTKPFVKWLKIKES